MYGGLQARTCEQAARLFDQQCLEDLEQFRNHNLLEILAGAGLLAHAGGWPRSAHVEIQSVGTKQTWIDGLVEAWCAALVIQAVDQVALL